MFCSFAAPLGYALFGTSRQLIVSPTSATAAISASLVAPLALSDVDRYRDLSMLLAILSDALAAMDDPQLAAPAAATHKEER